MEISKDSLFRSVKEIISQSHDKIFRIANSTLLLTYWQIGKLIVKDGRQGKESDQYGKYTLKNLSQKLTLELGKGFDESNPRNMCSFYQTFPICNAWRHELSWTHYRLLIRPDNSDKMSYYNNEAIQNNWNYKDLKKQINSLVCEIVLEHQKSSSENLHSVLKDPYKRDYCKIIGTE